MNAYVTVAVLKSAGALNITGSDHDDRLSRLTEAASRTVDRYCNRHFYVLDAAMTFDGGGLTILTPDLIRVHAGGLKTDEDRDRVFETTWEERDYRLLPANADPASAGNQASRPYTRVEVDAWAGSGRRFPPGRGTVRIQGLWGWWQHLRRAAETTAPVNPADTSITVNDGAALEAGHTVLIGSEQMHVRGRAGGRLEVTRAVNGATAQHHAAGAAVDVHEYPAPVAEAVLIQASRLWRRKDAAFGSLAGMPETGLSLVGSGLDPDAALLLSSYRKMPAAVGA